jgi:hypothetical protein
MCCAQAFTDPRVPEWYRGASTRTVTPEGVPDWAVQLVSQFRSSLPNDVHPYLAARGWDLGSAVTYADLARAYAAGLQWTTYLGVPEEHMENVDEIIANEQFLVAHNQ